VNVSATTLVVIGGGVIGLSTAYHLARKGVGRVILLEKERVGAGASSRAGGIITGLLWTEAGVAARQIALRLYRELSAELGPYGYQFNGVGCLNLFDAAAWQEREPLLTLYDRLGVAYEIMAAQAMMRRWPALRLPPDIVGLFDPLGGYSEPADYLPALARRCAELGVEIREGTLVQELLTSGGQVTAVQTAGGAIAADLVISTVHVWTLKLLAGLGYQLPIKSFVHQRYVTAPLAAPPDLPAVNANPYGGYFRPAAGGRLLVGGETAERAEFPVPELGFRMAGLAAPAGLPDQLRSDIQPILPALAGTSWESEEVGLLSFSLDGEPILGPVPGLANLLVGCAFHSGGFAYNPVAGLLLAELAAGEKPGIDIASFAPARYSQAETAAYLAQTLAQKEAIQRRH
jgi:sarcosine dehydrogenase